MIVGADASSDATVLATSARLYGALSAEARLLFRLQPDPGCELGATAPGEAAAAARTPAVPGRLALRFYGFSIEDVTASRPDGMLDLEMDPKLAWALANRGQFPADVNVAARESLLRVPGFGVKTVNAILAARRHRRLRLDDLARLRVPLRKARPWIVAEGWTPLRELDRSDLAALVAPPPQQLALL
jgi:predicted DNA-binding helix-hairpin-helix protein